MLARLKRFYASHARHSSDDVLFELCENVSVPPDSALLDIGCGSGEATARFGRALGARQLFGLDGSVSQARAAAERGVRVAIADFERPFPFANARFHVVALNQVIEHIRNLDLFVSELARILHPGGHLLLATPNLASWDEHRRAHAAAAGLFPDHFVEVLPRKPILESLQKANPI